MVSSSARGRWPAPLLGLGALLVGLGALVLAGLGGGTKSYVEGMVVDAGTGRPVSDVLVAVRNRGWGFVDGRLVWDKDYVYQSRTDGGGRFRIEYDVGPSAHVVVTTAGYQPFDGWFESNSAVVVELRPSA